MICKVSNFIADYLVRQGISDLFEVVGGGAMHLNDAFGHQNGLTVTYCHHEQAAAIAAEAYARLSNRMAAVCVTSGPGATNAMTGCLCAYMGSIPMIIFSGQVRYSLTVRAHNLNLRTNGEQEYDICRSAAGMTKYCEMVVKPDDILYCLQKALFLARAGRPGPVWLDVPLDVQGASIDTDRLRTFDPAEEGLVTKPSWDHSLVSDVLARIAQAKRPVLYCGQGIRLSGAYESFLTLVDKLGIPVTTGMTTLDYLPDDHPLYAGRPGATGDRAGNFALQNSDLLLSIGSRLSYKQTGYDTGTWARAAYKIMVDIDPDELRRPELRIDLPICADAGDFIDAMLSALSGAKAGDHAEWVRQCRDWVEKYPVVTPDLYDVKDGKGSTYVFYKVLSGLMPEGAVYVTTSGNSRVVCRQAARIKKGQRVITNHPTSPMGYCLPASVGTCIANGRRPIVLVTGEGGFQMNIQELQTIKQNKLPIRIIVINNGGYHSIRITQNAFFKDHTHVGIGPESGDLSFPDLERIADAYGFRYFESRNLADLEQTLQNLLACDTYALCQVFVTSAQYTQPKSSSKQLPGGQMASLPLEDMAPFLPRAELRQNMFIPLADASNWED
jgi:acetolactate synthase-1/2/3 large subunit